MQAAVVQASSTSEALTLLKQVAPHVSSAVLSEADISLLGTGVVGDTSGLAVSVTQNGGTAVFTVAGQTGGTWDLLGTMLAAAISQSYGSATYDVVANEITIQSNVAHLGTAVILAETFVGEAAQPSLAPVVNAVSVNPLVDRIITLPPDGTFARVFFLGQILYPAPPSFHSSRTYG